MDTEEFDVVVIGGGPAGENAAQYATQGTPLTAAIVEDELLGGECSYWACMPSKALLRPLEVADAARHLGGLAGVRVVPDGLLERRDAWRSQLDDAGQVRWAESAGLVVVRGRGRLAGERRVEVLGASGEVERTLVARHAVVLATGSSAAVPRALSGVAPWTSRDATGVLEAPERLAIVGGGVVACEAATWLAALGSRVTLLVRGGRLLPRNEEFASDAVAAGLRASGVDVRFEVEVTAARRSRIEREPVVGRLHGGPVVLGYGPGAAEGAGVTEEFDEVLAATGRTRNVSGLGLEVVGVSEDVLDGRVDLGNGWLYAVGDVSGGPQLTHWGKYQARVIGPLIASRALGPGGSSGVSAASVARALGAPVPQVVFTSPQVAQVGPTLAEARERWPGVRAIDKPLTSAAGYALLRDDASGMARLLVADDRIVGATFVGSDVAELLHAATVSIVSEASVETLRQAVPAYPTASETWLRLLEG